MFNNHIKDVIIFIPISKSSYKNEIKSLYNIINRSKLLSFIITIITNNIEYDKIIQYISSNNIFNFINKKSILLINYLAYLDNEYYSKYYYKNVLILNIYKKESILWRELIRFLSIKSSSSSPINIYIGNDVIYKDKLYYISVYSIFQLDRLLEDSLLWKTII